MTMIDGREATYQVCGWCGHRLPLPGGDYEYCPKCKGSFSFRKPETVSQPAAEIRSAPRPALSSACAEGDEASRAAGLDGEWLLPAQIVTERFGRDGKWVTEYAVLGSNIVEMCRCKDEQTARYIVCAVNQMPRVSIAKGAL
jgi:hypothetical protein